MKRSRSCSPAHLGRKQHKSNHTVAGLTFDALKEHDQNIQAFSPFALLDMAPSCSLVHACVDRLRKTYLTTPGQTVEAKVVEAIKTVINHCLATYFDSNAENDQEFVHQARGK